MNPLLPGLLIPFANVKKVMKKFPLAQSINCNPASSKNLSKTMDHLGIMRLLEQEIDSGESPMETVPLWWWVGKEPSSPHRMEPHGLQGLLEQHTISMESPTGMVPSW